MANGKFEMSSSAWESKTFIPHFHEDEEAGLVYVDVAGLKDAGTPIIKILNCFILLYIFQKATSVKFLMTVPYGNLVRCISVRKDFEAMQ